MDNLFNKFKKHIEHMSDNDLLKSISDAINHCSDEIFIDEEYIMCEHKWVHFETRYLYISNYPGSSKFKRIDRFFCEKCCKEKVIEKECYDYEDRHPEWFNFNDYERA